MAFFLPRTMVVLRVSVGISDPVCWPVFQLKLLIQKEGVIARNPCLSKGLGKVYFPRFFSLPG